MEFIMKTTNNTIKLLMLMLAAAVTLDLGAMERGFDMMEKSLKRNTFEEDNLEKEVLVKKCQKTHSNPVPTIEEQLAVYRFTQKYIEQCIKQQQADTLNPK
jgi:hypothetical protein